MPLVAVTAQDVDTSGIEIEVELPEAWLDRELQDASAHGLEPARVRARLSRSGGQVVVRGSVKALVSVPCARCLEPAKIELAGELSLLLRPAPHEHDRGAHHAHHAHEKADAKEKKAAPAESAKWAEAAAKMMPGWAAASKKGATDAPGGKDAKKGKSSDKKSSSKKTGGRREKELDEYEFSPEEADIDTFDGETIVLDAFIREALLLEMPNFPLCSETCPGIGAAAPPARDAGVGAANRVLDPRLAPLAALSASLSTRARANGQGQKSASPDDRARADTDANALPDSARTSAKSKTKKTK